MPRVSPPLTTTLRDGGRAIRRNRFLLVILGFAFLLGAASEGLDRLWEIHLYKDYTLPSLGGISASVLVRDRRRRCDRALRRCARSCRAGSSNGRVTGRLP